MDNPLRGIALLVGATIFFSVSDSIAKLLGAWVAMGFRSPRVPVMGEINV